MANKNSVTLWLKGQPQTMNLRIGYFGASTGAAAALNSVDDPYPSFSPSESCNAFLTGCPQSLLIFIMGDTTV